jgi:putative iron-dependent peroxidase
MPPGHDYSGALRRISELSENPALVFGLGHRLVSANGESIPGLKAFPEFSREGCEVPSTQADIWCWVRGQDRGQILHLARSVAAALSPEFAPVHSVDGFCYGSGLDLTGYEDGTENPDKDTAPEVALVHDQGKGLDGSSFVAVQQWMHDLDHFESLPVDQRDHIIGRRISDNSEIDDALETAHVKRTAQETFTPEAFILRRSMPWTDSSGAGLYFSAFGNSLKAFEAQLERMVGDEDGIADALFRFSRPITGGYYWCPPKANGRLDLSALGI